jgi:hypothetical protein
MDLWLVGQYKSGDWPEVVWEFTGIFDSEQKAVHACRDWTYFVAPIKLNKQLPHETVHLEGEYYPMQQGAQNG